VRREDQLSETRCFMGHAMDQESWKMESVSMADGRIGIRYSNTCHCGEYNSVTFNEEGQIEEESSDFV